MKNIKWILAVVCCFIFSGVSFGQEVQDQTTKSLSDTEKIVGLSKCWSEVKCNFVYYDKLAFSWDSLYQATIPVVLATKSDFEYYRELQRFFATLKDGHTSVSFPRELWKNWATIPVVTKLVENKVFVSKVLNDTLRKEGITKGLEVTKINGMDIHEYASTYIKPYSPSSTDQWLNRVYAREITRGKRSEPARLTFKDDKGKVFERSISHSMSEEDMPDTPLFDFKVLDNNIGLLKISSFMGNRFTQEFDSIYQLMTNVNSLVIDIRGNGGGNTNNSVYILSHFTSKNFKMSNWSSPLYIPAHASWNFPKEWYTSVSYDYSPIEKKEIFDKPVLLLINQSTFSAAEDFCVGFRTMKRGLIVGTPSGGSTGNPIGFELPGGGWMQICSKKDTYPDGTEFVGVGILPDIEVKETIASYLSDKSLVLEKAVQLLKK